MKSRGKKLILWLLAAALMIGAMPAAVLGDEKDMEIPPVYHRDDDNETVRIVIGKTPNITIGKTSTISVAVKNTSASDWIESEIWIAQESEFKDYYEQIDETEDGDIIKTMINKYPFEITDSLNKHYKIGHVKAGASKTVNLRVNVKKDLTPGYYPVLVNVSKRSSGEGALSSGYQKTIMVWAETKETSTTKETDEGSTEPVAFALGEDQPTPQGEYQQRKYRRQQRK